MCFYKKMNKRGIKMKRKKIRKTKKASVLLGLFVVTESSIGFF